MIRLRLGLVLVLMIFEVRSFDLHTNDPLWKGFKYEFNKTYDSTEEEILRYTIFKQNANLIHAHNEAADKGYHSFWVAINHLTDMTHEEYLTKMNGLLRDTDADSQDKLEHEKSPQRLNLSTVADEVDWRTSGCITPVKYQGHCGSCYAFASTGSLEFQHCRKTGKLVSLSEQNIIDCTTNSIYHDNGCKGGKMDQAFEYIISNGGIDTEKSYPYHAVVERKCKYRSKSKGATMVAFKDVLPRGDEEQLKRAVGSHGPVAVGVDASDLMFKFYTFGLYDNIFCSSILVDHAVLVVGYGTEDGSDYWLIKNSWSKRWGIQGYMKMVRNKGNRCGIATMASYPIV